MVSKSTVRTSGLEGLGPRAEDLAFRVWYLLASLRPAFHARASTLHKIGISMLKKYVRFSKE